MRKPQPRREPATDRRTALVRVEGTEGIVRTVTSAAVSSVHPTRAFSNMGEHIFSWRDRRYAKWVNRSPNSMENIGLGCFLKNPCQNASQVAAGTDTMEYHLTLTLAGPRAPDHGGLDVVYTKLASTCRSGGGPDDPVLASQWTPSGTRRLRAIGVVLLDRRAGGSVGWLPPQRLAICIRMCSPARASTNCPGSTSTGSSARARYSEPTLLQPPRRRRGPARNPGLWRRAADRVQRPRPARRLPALFFGSPSRAGASSTHCC